MGVSNREMGNKVNYFFWLKSIKILNPLNGMKMSEEVTCVQKKIDRKESTMLSLKQDENS